MKYSLYFKALRVIASCRSLDQWVVAAKYLVRAEGIIPALQHAFIAQVAMEKFVELEEKANECI